MNFDDKVPEVKISEIDSESEGHERIIEGIIVGMNDIEHYDSKIIAKCKQCKKEPVFENKGDFRTFDPDIICTDCKIGMKIIQTDHNEVRKILIQEDSSQPESLPCFLFGKHVRGIKASDKVRFWGVLRSVKKHKADNTYKRVFDVIKVSRKNPEYDKPSKEEIEKFKLLNKEDIINSFAPQIKNMETIKEGLLITLIGGVDRYDIRGDINTFLVGDPGTAKTKLLKFITKIIEPSDYASGKSSSAAGLLAGVDNLPDGTRIARAGPVVLCNNGVVCVDEMDKMNSFDRSALHEAMESQSFSLVKIGINMKWPTKTIIIGAANPYGGNKWNPKLSIRENIRLPDSLLSRFGLIFLVRDIPERDRDMEIARHILLSRQGKIETKLSEKELKKFLIHANSIECSLSDEAGNILLKWWSDLRLETQPEEAPSVDNRVLEDLNRIAEAYSRFRFSKVVEEEDAKQAINLLKESLKTLGMKTPGERNESLSEFLNKDDYFKTICNDTNDMVVAKMLRRPRYWKTKEQAESYIQKVKNAGLIIENGDNLKWVD